ncbi:YfiR family protein [Pseudoalteromonas sp. MMG024]|uniref:YfiR family protein n=1 Tax=Pseudoalteromonas sp. MMG024 TaxID=2909980 RepID=UPI001F25827F|nr:YfiR family protein [Pseudoalteromonas sp. MMG024]MCF6458379.1 YfiR family protein [Pseudoalteromonas sp. MMG024]
MRLLLLVIIGLFSSFVSAKTAEQLRAAYLMQIPSFVRYTDPNHKPYEITFCFAEQLGPVGELINAQQQVLRQRLNFSLQVIDTLDLDKLKQCSYLYLSKDIKNTDRYLEKITNHTITVGEQESTLSAGALMALVQEQKKIRMHINQTKLDENIISFNARLLALAKVASY